MAGSSPRRRVLGRQGTASNVGEVSAAGGGGGDDVFRLLHNVVVCATWIAVASPLIEAR